MSDVSHANSRTRFRGWTARGARTIAALFEAIAAGAEAARHSDVLSSLSDAELGRRGLTRERLSSGIYQKYF